MSALGPSRHLVRRSGMSAIGAQAEVGRTPSIQPLQPFLQRHRIVMGLVARRVEERDRLAAKMFAQTGDRRACRISPKLTVVGCDELPPFARVAMKTAAQRLARRDVLEPQIDARLFFRDTARP